MLQIRCAGASDLPALTPLKRHIHGLHVAGNPKKFIPMTDDEIQRGFADALDRDDARVVLAEMDSIVAGYAVFVKVVTPERPGVRASRTGLIDELCVSPDFRRRGVGRALMEEVKRLCAELTLDRLELTVWTFNESALAFYRDCGFDDVMHRLSMPI